MTLYVGQEVSMLASVSVSRRLVRMSASWRVSIMDEDAEAQLHLCQNLYFKSLNADPSQKLDCLRGLMQQAVFAQKSHNLSSRAMSMLITDYGDQYAKILDSGDTSTGVKNYADEALSLASLKNSEVDKWQSGLKLDDIESISGIKAPLDNSSITEEQHADNALFLKQLQENWTAKNEPVYELPSYCDENKKNNVASNANQPQTSNRKAPLRTSRNNGETTVLPAKPSNVYQAENLSSFVQSNVFPSVQTFDKGSSGLTGVKRRQEEAIQTVERKLKNGPGPFRTARDQLALDIKSNKAAPNSFSYKSYGTSKKSLGSRRGGISGRFVPPILNKDEGDEDQRPAEELQDERLKNIEAKMVELIKNEIMDQGPPVKWDDIAGLEFVKKTIKEIVVFPMLRPDIFTGLRGPPKGLLLFGPPGTGKTLIGKCIASNSRSTFFSISASSLTSKWVGEGEKMVRALFAVARCHQPAVIFIDEIDSLLTQRSDTEHESSRRMKTEFLVQLDGATTDADDKLLVVGATNRPQELDEAARRRLVKRLYVPLPEHHARKQIIVNLLNDQSHNLTGEDIEEIGIKAEGYSGADMANLCKEAALGPVRCLSFDDIEQISVDEVRPITKRDFMDALHQIKPSVSTSDLRVYLEWNLKFGSTHQQ